MARNYKILIADDSSLMRLIISDIVKSHPELTVIGTASNGEEAYQKTKSLKPDLVLLDMVMEGGDGNYATKKIMKDCPTPILILSALGNTNMTPILEAMENGALDYLSKPESGQSKIRGMEKQIVDKVVAICNSKYKVGAKKSNANTFEHTFSSHLPYDIIAIGSSTGGPRAVEDVLTKLPANLPMPVVVAQHMPDSFIKSFVKRLNGITPLEVVKAQEGDTVRPGYIYVMSGDANYELIKKGPITRIGKNPKKYANFNDPSVDCLFDSVAANFRGKSISVILTGMGRDGALGMKKIKDGGGLTIAQSKETCVVYGMPKAAEEEGGVMYSVNIKEIGGFIISCLA